MPWWSAALNVLTPLAALVGAALGIYNTVAAHRRNTPQLRAECVLEENEGRVQRLRIDVVNAGHVPVTIVQVFLASRSPTHPKVPVLLQDGLRRWEAKYLAPGARIQLLSRQDADAFHFPFMAKVYGITFDLGGGSYRTLKSATLSRHAKKLRDALPK